MCSHLRENFGLEQSQVTINTYKYHQNTTDLLYSTTSGLHVLTP